ncbi:MAG: tetratricopeptide repeat protein [Fibrobacteres bacterium]|nr:tetratricopeptide repeat protein [Fibrobacterota bacterium]
MSIRYTADQLQRKFPGSAASPGFARVADALRAEGRLDEAVSLCLEGLRARPHVAGYVVLGKTHLDAGRLEEAREQFEAALRLDPRCLSAMRSLALIMDRLQWGDAAAGYYRSILEVEPWDAEIRALLEGSGSTGTAPAASAPSETSRYAPPTPSGRDEDTFAKPDGLQGDVMEVNLNDMADDFLPSGSDVPNLASLEDSFPSASGTTQFPAGDFSPASDSAADPRPMDMLSTSTGPETLGENAPAPISGSDVEDRLDSIFGSEEGGLPSATATWTAAAPRSDMPPEASATATGEMRSLETPSDFPIEAEPFDLGDLPGASDAATPASESFENSVTDLPRTAPSGEDLEDGDERVQGEDIERRLDELFNLTGEEETPKPAALSASDLPVAQGPNLGETVIMGDAVAFGDRAAAAPSEIASGEMVTGQDVADKLDSMLGPDPKAKASDEASLAPVSSATATTAAPAAVGPFADLLPPFSDVPTEDEPAPRAEPATQVEPAPQAGLAPSFGDETILSTETMPPAGWQVDAPQVTGADVEAQLDRLFNLEPDPPRASAEPATAQADREPPFQGNMNDTVAADARDTLILPSEDVFPASFQAATRSEGATAFDTLAPEELPSLSESASIEMVDGGDVAERLDKLFADAGAVPAQEEPLFETDLAGMPDPFPEPDVTMEMPIVKLDESGPAAEGEDESSLFPSSPSMTGKGAATAESDLAVADARWDGTPSDAAGAGPVAAAPELSPMMDEEDGYPAEEEMPEQAAGANVATVTLAEIYFQQGLKEQALQIYRQLQEREPENESVRKRIAEIEASKAEGDRGPESDPRWPRPGLKVPKRKK